MTKTPADPRQQQRQAAEKAQQEASRNQQKAQQEKIAGRHKNDGQKGHEGADKGPRGQ